MRRCSKCKKLEKKTFHTHHITYYPEKTIILCERCHGLITSIDIYARRLFRKKRLYKRKFKKDKYFRNSLIDNYIREIFFTYFMSDEIDTRNFGKSKRRQFVKAMFLKISFEQFY